MLRGMKLRIGIVVLACALGACKDKKAATVPETEAAPCARTAAHVTKVMQSEMGDSLAESDWPKLTAALEQRCTEDEWAAEVRACMDDALSGNAGHLARFLDGEVVG